MTVLENFSIFACGTGILLFSVQLAHCDETKSGQVPVKYKEAQDIIAKRKIDGKKKTAQQIFLEAYRDAMDKALGITAKPVTASKKQVKESPKQDEPVIAFDLATPPAPPRGGEPMVDAGTMRRLKESK